LHHLLQFLYPESSPLPSVIRVLYVGTCSKALTTPTSPASTPATSPAAFPYGIPSRHLLDRVAVQCLSDDDAQAGHCNWFLHADDRDAGTSRVPTVLKHTEPAARSSRCSCLILTNP
jgi:hypothetical protein